MEGGGEGYMQFVLVLLLIYELFLVGELVGKVRYGWGREMR